MKPQTWRAQYLKTVPWTKEQLTVFNTVKECPDNISVEAVAGSGKTTLIFGLIAALPANAKIKVLAFNKHIALKLRNDERIPKNRVSVGTCHSTGMGMMIGNWGGTKPKVDPNKYSRLVKQQLREIRTYTDLQSRMPVFPRLEPEEIEEFVESTADIAEFAHKTLNGTKPEQLEGMARYYGINVPAGNLKDWALKIAGVVIDQGLKEAINDKIISYGEMLYFPYRMGLLAPKKDYVIVDEYQDLSAAQLRLVSKFAEQGAKVILLGDNRQSINGFAGADPDAVNRANEKFNTLRLDLSVCFRCPSWHLDLARTFNSKIMPATGAGEGIVSVCHPDLLPDKLVKGDLVISRLTLPLINCCLEALKAGLKVGVRGGDLASSLKRLAFKANQPGKNFLVALQEHVDKEWMKLNQYENVAEIDKLQGVSNALIFAYQQTRPHSLDELLKGIEKIFNLEKPDIEFSTIHRAKGGEADRVFLLGSNLMPYYNTAQFPWQRKEEDNLTYVALTRAKHELVFVPYLMEDVDGDIEELMEHPYGGLELPKKITRIDAPRAPKEEVYAQLALFPGAV